MKSKKSESGDIRQISEKWKEKGVAAKSIRESEKWKLEGRQYWIAIKWKWRQQKRLIKSKKEKVGRKAYKS